jgi:predicted nicotinamide N-methyase
LSTQKYPASSNVAIACDLPAPLRPVMTTKSSIFDGPLPSPLAGMKSLVIQCRPGTGRASVRVVNEADLVEEVVPVRGWDFVVSRPRDADALLSEAEEQFDVDEFLPYWAELWSSGRALADVVLGRALRGARVLELGCGLALPSFAAAAAGGRVVASDWSPSALSLVSANAARNGLEVATMELDWFSPPSEVGWFDLVLASDVLYEQRNGFALLDLLPRLGREVWLADPGRVPAGRFFADAVRDWEVRSDTHPAVPNGGVYRLRRR